MDEIETSEDVDRNRRRFFGAAAMTFAAAQLGMVGSANAQAVKPSAKALPEIIDDIGFAGIRHLPSILYHCRSAESICIAARFFM